MIREILEAHRRAAQEAVLAAGRITHLLQTDKTNLSLPAASRQLSEALGRLKGMLPALPPRRKWVEEPTPLPMIRDLPVISRHRTAEMQALVQQEIWGSKGLLAEIIKRAANDWVLYRLHGDLFHKQLAEEAFTWLFEEKPGHPNWTTRMLEGRPLTAFITICEILDLDVDAVRNHIRLLTPQDVRNAGRPPERRRRKRSGSRTERRLLAG